MPSDFFNKTCARDALTQVACVSEGDTVSWVEVPEYGAFLIWAEPACGAGESAWSEIQETTGEPFESETRSFPEMYFILKDLQKCPDYNKILCTWAEGYLYLAIAQGRTLLLANTYPAGDFATVQYYIFLALKSLQLNPEISAVCFRSPLSKEDEVSMYRYFKAVEVLCE